MKKENPNMKKAVTAAKIVASMTAAMAIGLNAAGCTDPDKKSGKANSKLGYLASRYDPDDNDNPHVYGPPKDYDPTNNDNPDVYGPPTDFDPSDNDPTCAYGPEPYNPSDNETRAVYGPPSDYDPSDNFPSTEYGPEIYDPSDEA